MKEYFGSVLFWVSVFQWMLLAPAVFYAQQRLARFRSMIANLLIELLLLVIVGGTLLFIPLLFLGFYPLPTSGYRFFVAGAAVGGAVSIFISRIIRQKTCGRMKENRVRLH
jgi:hypothetical protein